MYYGTFYLSGTIQLEKESKDLDVTCVLCSVPLIASLGIRWVMKYPQSSPQLTWSLCPNCCSNFPTDIQEKKVLKIAHVYFQCFGVSERVKQRQSWKMVQRHLIILQAVGLCKAMQQYDGDKGNSLNLKHISAMP